MVTRIPSKDALGVRFPLNAFTIEFYMYILIYIEHMPKSRRVKKKRTRGGAGGTRKSRGLSHSSSTSSLPSSSSRPRLPRSSSAGVLSRSSSAGVLSRSSSTSKSSHDSSTKTPEKTNLSIIQTHQKRIYMLANMIT